MRFTYGSDGKMKIEWLCKEAVVSGCIDCCYDIASVVLVSFGRVPWNKCLIPGAGTLTRL